MQDVQSIEAELAALRAPDQAEEARLARIAELEAEQARLEREAREAPIRAELERVNVELADKLTEWRAVGPKWEQLALDLLGKMQKDMPVFEDIGRLQSEASSLRQQLELEPLPYMTIPGGIPADFIRANIVQIDYKRRTGRNLF